MDPDPPPPRDASSILPKFSRYKSVRRPNAGITQNGLAGVQAMPGMPKGFESSTASRYRRAKPSEPADRIHSVPATLPNHPPPRPYLPRSNTNISETALNPDGELQSGQASPTTLNKAQQQAFDILTGKVDQQQQALQRKVDEEKERKAQLEEKKRREELAEGFRKKSEGEQAKRIAEQRALSDARQNALRQARAERDAERRGDGGKQQSNGTMPENNASKQTWEPVPEVAKSSEDLKASSRRPDMRAGDMNPRGGYAEGENRSRGHPGDVKRETRMSNEEMKPYTIRPGQEERQYATKISLSREHLRRAPDAVSATHSKESGTSSFDIPPKLPTQPYSDLHNPEQVSEQKGTEPSRKLVKRHTPKGMQSGDSVNPLLNSPEKFEALQSPKEAPGPNFDAPKSAVNAGTRTVKVFFGEKSMQLPVTPTSTPVELLSSAKDLLEYGFDPNRYVLEESFSSTLELERPLRQYERVRDVMNSWNSDEQNYFTIVSAATQWDTASLKYANAPREPPDEFAVTVYHSQRPKTWDKRVLTLHTDGQVVIQKHIGAPATKLCHMSDFDVFQPNKKQMKHLKTPRKYCLVIKSLQKPAAFLDTGNFVHFICTKDPDLIMEWYKAIHGWRSWYMVNALGLGKEQPGIAAADEPKEPLVSNIRGRNNSSTSSNQQLAPAYDGRIAPDAAFVTSPSSSSPQHTLPSRPFNTRGGPPPSFARAMNRDPDDGGGSRNRARSTSRTRSSSTARDSGPPSLGPDPFTSTGLLGRTYTLRRQALDETEANDEAIPALPGGGKPLIDLTPEKKTAQQFAARKGHGVQLDSVPTGGLVSAATNITAEHQPTNDAVAVSGGLQRSTSTRRTRTMRNEPPPPDAFTGGLLASSVQGFGERRMGRGVASGDRNAEQPLVNLNIGSQYSPGSLLRSVEQHQGSKGPVIEREKVCEGVVRTGEGF